MAGTKETKYPGLRAFGELMKSRWGGFIVIATLFVLLLLLYPGNNVFSWISARIQIGAQEREIRRYRTEIMEMDARIRDLTDNRDSLEKFARENFHFARPGEDVYLVDE